MRIPIFMTMALAALATTSSALETAAGTDTVASSQVGINAKVDASAAVLQTGLNNIITCNKDGQLWTADGCVAVDEPLAKKIAACTTDKRFYDQNTGACMNSAPDLTNQLNATNDMMSRLIACYNAHGTFNASTGQCASGGSGTLQLVGTYTSNAKNSIVTTGPYKADLCVISYTYMSAFDNTVGGCQVTGSPWSWTMVTNGKYSRENASCSVTCFNLKQ